MKNLTPVEIDTELARLWRIESEAKARRDHYLRPRRDGQPASDANKRAAAGQETIRAQARTDAAPYEAEYSDRGGWNRYFLVQNTGGHVHRGMHCVTCYPTTQYSWLVELADCDEAQMVEEWGEMACTVCFPNAPAHPRFAEPSRRDLAAREAKAAERAARDAKKAEKNLTADETFRGYMSWVTTVAGAKQAIRDAIEMANYGEAGHRHSWADAAETAAATATTVLLARGVPQAEIDRIVANTTKRVAKENAR